MTVSGADIGDGKVDTTGGHAGITLTFGTNGPGNLVAGQSMNFEYIAKNEAKFELNDASGQATQIARNATGSLSGLYSYAAAAATYQSGRGVSVKLGTGAGTEFAEMAVGEVERFTYKQANNYSVDVSTTQKAGAYMTTANYALDKVNSALSGLGSLMARLSFKEEAISTAQVNVEGAYNRIMNANMAEEQVNASKYTILQQTATAMLAQANAAPQSLLALFR